MVNYNYVLDAPFESNKFFACLEKDMKDNKVRFAGGRGYIVNDVIELNHRIRTQLDYMKIVFFQNFTEQSITPLVGYIQTAQANTGSILNSELIRLYIEFEVCKYIIATSRITNKEVKNAAEKVKDEAVEKIKSIIR